jgi:hypothetical protein
MVPLSADVQELGQELRSVTPGGAPLQAARHRSGSAGSLQFCEGCGECHTDLGDWHAMVDAEHRIWLRISVSVGTQLGGSSGREGHCLFHMLSISEQLTAHWTDIQLKPSCVGKTHWAYLRLRSSARCTSQHPNHCLCTRWLLHQSLVRRYTWRCRNRLGSRCWCMK